GVGYLLEAPIQKENEKMHYEFCGDLGIKATHEQAFDYQPKFVLFEARNTGDSAHLDEIKKRAEEKFEQEGKETKDYLKKYRGLFSRKFFLVVGCEEQAKQILAGDPQGRKGLFKHSEKREEILFTKDPQFTE
ncbi:5425_t:CDS:2, partial [Scutellospora calospora]